MLTTKIDYKQLQFLLYQDGHQLANPLPDEVQRVLVSQIIDDVYSEFRKRWLAQKFEDRPPGLNEKIRN